MTDRASYDGSEDGLARLEELLLGARPHLTRREVADRAGVDLDTARRLWRMLGFAETDDETAAFTDTDVLALQHTRTLVELGIIDEERERGLVRTWARSFARLAEWQAALLADVAAERGIDPGDGALLLADDVVPRVEELQSIVWRRHLTNAAARVLVGDEQTGSTQAVLFVDIVGYTSRSKSLDDRELVAWLEAFESAAMDVVVEHGGRIIKNIGDELLLVTDTARAAAAIALELTARGRDEDDPFPQVRAGLAYGDVVLRLGDVYGPVVNVAARLTSVARPGTVLVDEGAHDALRGAGRGPAAGERNGDAEKNEDVERNGSGGDDRGGSGDRGAEESGSDPAGEGAAPDAGAASYRMRRVPRLSVKGYPRLRAWALRPA